MDLISADMIVALATLLLVIATIWLVRETARGVQEQLWTLTFTEYTKRYADIVEIFPDSVRRPGASFDFNSISPDDRERIMRGMRRYLNLCSEEMFLHSRKKIDKATWEIWKTGMRDTARFPCYRESWRHLRFEYDCYPDFRDFMDEIVAGAGSLSID